MRLPGIRQISRQVPWGKFSSGPEALALAFLCWNVQAGISCNEQGVSSLKFQKFLFPTLALCGGLILHALGVGEAAILMVYCGAQAGGVGRGIQFDGNTMKYLEVDQVEQFLFRKFSFALRHESLHEECLVRDHGR